MAATGQNVQTSGRAGASRRAAARLAAVQALYQVEIGGAAPDDVIDQFLKGERPEPEAEENGAASLPPPDTELFTALVKGVIAERSKLDDVVGGALSAEWTVGRLEILVRLILEAGAFELTAMPEVPPKVAINEYVNVAHAFFEGAEPGLVNGVLDAVAKRVRPSPASGGAA